MFITLSAMASVGLIAIIAVIAIIILLVIANIKIVPQSKAYVIERLGAYFATWDTGLHVKIPFIDKVAKKVLLKSPSEEIDATIMSELEISPANDTTYTLVSYAVDESISVSKDITVRVLHDVAINDFSSDIPQTLESQPVELRWDIENADKIMLYPNDIDITHQNSLKVFPNRAMTYRIVASNAISIKEALLSIGVRPLPKLDVKVSDSLSRLEIPNCEIDLTPLTTSIKETDLDRWMLSPIEQSVTKTIWGKGLFKRIKKILNKRIKL